MHGRSMEGSRRLIHAAAEALLVLIVGRGETTMREKVDPRRAQVAQVGERGEYCAFILQIDSVVQLPNAQP